MTGGIDLAAEAAGFKTICFCEIDSYCQKVLRKHWPDVPIVEDIRDVTREKIMAYAEGREPRKPTEQEGGQDSSRGSQEVIGRDRGDTATVPPITLVTGGVPCQPASVAGKRRGTEDDRWFWPEAIRILSEVKPTWAVFENPTGILTLEGGVVFDNLLSQMEAEGYEVQSICIPACAVNAPHRRDRVFIVAYATRLLRQSSGSRQRERQLANQDEAGMVADTEDTDRRRTSRKDDIRRGNKETGRCSISGCGIQHWATEPDVGRVAHGIPSRVDRLRCLGNAVVPAQIYPVLRAIADIEGIDNTVRIE